MTSPKVSFLLLCYDREQYIRSAVRAAFAQDYAPLEIVISDDGSKDGTFDIVEQEAAAYDGGHTVRLNRNESNLGEIEHYNKVVSLARGDFLVFAHGDDISLPHRTRRLAETWHDRGVSLVSSKAEVIDADGVRIGFTGDADTDHEVTAEQIVDQGWNTSMLGSTTSCHRDVFSKFGGLNSDDLFVGTDHVIPFRATLLNGMYYLAEPLVQYRKHDRNLTNTIFDRTGGKRVMRETQVAFSANNRISMFDDLLKVTKDRPDDPDLRALAQNLRASLLLQLRNWTRLRNTLMREGLRPTWVEKEILDAKPIEQDWTFGTPTRRDRPSESGSEEA